MNKQNILKDAIEILQDANKHVSMMKQRGTCESYKTALEFEKIAEQIVVEAIYTIADAAADAVNNADDLVARAALFGTDDAYREAVKRATLARQKFLTLKAFWCKWLEHKHSYEQQHPKTA